MAKYVGRLKLGWKPAQLYVRLSIRPLGKQAYHVRKGIIRYYLATAAGQGDRVSIPGRVIPKTQKMVPDTALLNTQHYKVLIKSKWSNPGKRVAPPPTSPEL